MKIIKDTPYENGAYPAIQSWASKIAPKGYYIWLDGLDTAKFYEYNGFVILNVMNNHVLSYEPNTEAWEAWKSTLPEPTAKPATDTEILNILLGLDEEDE